MNANLEMRRILMQRREHILKNGATNTENKAK